MLQVLYIDVVKVHQDVAHVVMAIHICFKCMIQMFHLFQTYVASVLSECCKSRSGCCIYMLRAYICFKYFIRMFASVFYLDVSYVCNGFQVFSSAFVSVSDVCFKCFICLLLYVVTVASGCFKSRSGVAHGMRVGNGWQRGRRSGRHGLTARVLACELCATVRTLALRIERLGASKSKELFNICDACMSARKPASSRPFYVFGFGCWATSISNYMTWFFLCT
jgi:hypothetical protein